MGSSIPAASTASQVVQDILQTCRQGAGKHAIVERCGISNVQAEQYLASLCLHGLLQKDQRGWFQVSPEGEQVLRSLPQLLAVLRGETQSARRPAV